MLKIDPAALRKCRDRKNWSQEELSRRTGIDKGTISRLERGTNGNVRGRTLELLSRQLDVSPEVLRGDEPIPPSEHEAPLWKNESQMNVRISNRARNALALVAARYRIPQNSIIELAPFFFVYAAERSLKQRAARIAQLEQKLDEASGLADNFRHLSSALTTFYQTEEILSSEKKSIRAHELFLGDIDSVLDTEALKDGYEDYFDSPFVHFLREIAEEIGDELAFEDWAGQPDYRVCKPEAVQFAGGDDVAAEEILSGHAPIHEMPKELRPKERAAERIKWILQRADETKREIETELGTL